MLRVRVPTSLPVDEEPDGEVVTTLYLPVISNQSQTKGLVADAASGRSGVTESLEDAPEAGESTTQILLPVISHQVVGQAEVSQSVASSSVQQRSATAPTAEEMTHQIMLPLVMNQ